MISVITSRVVRRVAGAAVGLIVPLALGCAARKDVVEKYQVVSHEHQSGEWVIVHVDPSRGVRVEIKAVCDFHQGGSRQPVSGPDSCDLRVGDTLMPVPRPANPQDLLVIEEDNDTLSITKSAGPDRVVERFRVRSSRIMDQ
jgi:hypothetical protein